MGMIVVPVLAIALAAGLWLAGVFIVGAIYHTALGVAHRVRCALSLRR